MIKLVYFSEWLFVGYCPENNISVLLYDIYMNNVQIVKKKYLTYHGCCYREKSVNVSFVVIIKNNDNMNINELILTYI